MQYTKKLITATVITLSVLTVHAEGTTVTAKDYQLPKCAAPVASVVIGKVACKSNSCMAPAAQPNSQLAALAMMAAQANGGSTANFAGIGDGMSAMLTTALKETGCFDIQEREAMDEVAKELALVGKKVEIQQADYMISGSITSISMSTQKSSFGGGLIPIIGAISNTKVTADLGMDIKIIDINKAKILDSKTFLGNNETSSTGIGLGGFVGGGLVGGAFSSTKGTPMEPVVRDVLTRVAAYASTSLVTVRGATPPTITPAQLSSQTAPVSTANP